MREDFPCIIFFFFFQAEDGIRDVAVTGVQTCALPILFMGTAWKWVWMYEVGGRKLGYLHPMETGLSGTFILTETEERELAVTDGLPRTSRQAIRDGRMSGGVRWCWMEFPDFDAVDAFVSIIRLKHQLLARPE